MLSVSTENPLYVLDTSAIMTLLEEEDGYTRVEQVLRSHDTLLPAIVLMETHYISAQVHGVETADECYAWLKQLPATIVWDLDQNLILTASRFKSQHRLSLADALIAAITTLSGGVLLHKDPEYTALKQDVEQEFLPFKKPS